MIAIIDYDAGNIGSVIRALDYLSEEWVLTRDKDEILKADKAILPGVGSFKDALDNIRKYDLEGVIKEFIASKKPFLGICLGLQLLFEESEESPNVKGLSVLPGVCKKIPSSQDIKVPHVGWNSLKLEKESKLFKDIPDNSYVYFVHSYYLEAGNKEDVAASTEYGVKIHAAVEHDNIFACQFHPEKSSDVGLKIIKNFTSL